MDAVELALRLIDLVERDTRLPSRLRADVAALKRLADRQPDLALSRLDAHAVEFAQAAPHDPPGETLVKVVTLDVFWQHYVRDEVRDAFRDPNQYAAYVTGLREAAMIEPALEAHLRRPGVLIPAAHSWLARNSDLDGFAGRELVTALELGSVGPPLVLLVLPSRLLRANEVAIRAPRATDAALGRQVQWRVTGLARGIPEYIDRDIPGSAVGSIRWRP